ncbi:hypothetical protein JMUB6875_42420 [Nocardia sp. JMUB6875]|uniref:hypothetical protein n=1 Tax=Nocardia sp. JMUB6875 TaxID=3158170 RepID=UPI0032E7D911
MNPEPTTTNTDTENDTPDATLGHETASGDHSSTPGVDGVADDVSNNPNAEAKKWRLKYRAAETELATARETVTRLQRAAIEKQVTDRLAVPADLFDVGGYTVESLLHDNGDPDPAKVHAAMRELLLARPGLTARGYNIHQTHPNWGQGQSAHFRDSGSAWDSVIKG